MYHAPISLKALAAANCAASTEETRFYLNGVFLEISARQVLYVATDGHVLFAYRDAVPVGEPANDLIGNWIVPSATIKAAKPKKGYPDHAILEGEPGQLGLALRLPDGSKFEFRAIDGTFPDWRRIVPRETEQKGPHPFFDPRHLAKLWKAGELLGLRAPIGMAFNSSGPAMLKYSSDDTFGLVMPIYNPIVSVSRPAWAAPPLETAKPESASVEAELVETEATT